MSLTPLIPFVVPISNRRKRKQGEGEIVEEDEGKYFTHISDLKKINKKKEQYLLKQQTQPPLNPSNLEGNYEEL